MANVNCSKVLPPDVRRYFAHFDIPKKLFYKLTNPEPVKATALTRPLSAGNG